MTHSGSTACRLRLVALRVTLIAAVAACLGDPPSAPTAASDGAAAAAGRHQTTPPTAPAVPTAEPVAGASWTYCVGSGRACEFTGLRDVRLGGPSGPYVQKVAYGSIPCAPYAFDNRNPAPGQALHCDDGPMKTETLTNPMPNMGPVGATVVVPRGAPGAAGPQVRSTSSQGSPASVGAFRTTCSLATFRFDDPIVYPGRPGASHLHMFFGNTAVNASSTPATLTAAGNSTCRGGTLNRSAYWVPALIDTRTGAAVAPSDVTVYYKTGYNMPVTAIKAAPAGLRMIAGDRSATTRQQFVSWTCRPPNGSYSPEQATVPGSCAVGYTVRLTLTFPQCWDGVNLDSPDHKRHMSYPIYRSSQKSGCPASHPVAIPEITELFDWKVTAAGASAFWRLASDMYTAASAGGLSAHADWMNGWNPATMQTFVTQCLNRGLDCGVGGLGNGTTLF